MNAKQYVRNPKAARDKERSKVENAIRRKSGIGGRHQWYYKQHIRQGRIPDGHLHISKNAQAGTIHALLHEINAVSDHRKNVGWLRRLFVFLALILFVTSKGSDDKTGFIWKITHGLDILKGAQAQVLLTMPEYTNKTESHLDSGTVKNIIRNEFEELSPATRQSMSLVRRQHIALSQFIDGDIYNNVTLIVLDTEGLAYHTDFTRSLLWVTRLTDNLLNLKKPYVQSDQEVCAIDNMSRANTTWRKPLQETYHDFNEKLNKNEHSRRGNTRKPTFARHLVPSYDGYIYCVYENNQTQLLHIHVRDIVNYTPFRTPLLEGVYLEGTRNSSVLALDYDTGHYMARHVNVDEIMEPFGKHRYQRMQYEEQRQLHIGYTDWIVRAFDEKTHDELWSFNWREIGPVNSEHVDAITVDRIREVIKVKGTKLCIQYNEDDESSIEELNFPFPIASVFAVMWNSNDEIMTLQPVARVSIPPPAAFLQNALDTAYGSLRLASSSYFGQNVVSVRNGVINVDEAWEAKKRPKERRKGGTLIKIQRVDQNPYYSKETQKPNLTILQQIQTRRHYLKFWVVLSWIFTFLFLLIMYIIRKIVGYFGIDKRCCKWIKRVPSAEKFMDRIIKTLMDLERAAFTSTEQFIYNINRASQIYPVDAVYKRIAGPTEMSARTGESPQNHENNDERSESTLSRKTEDIEKPHSTDGNTESHEESNNRTTRIVEETDVPKNDSIKSISVVPTGTALADFLENGRFLRTFECIQLLGKGGFGSVYRVQHKLEPGHPIYAIKFVLLKLKASEGLTSRRYFREVSANREIFSKYVVRYFTWWCEEPHFLPLMQLTPDMKCAAAANVKHLIGANVLTSKNKKMLNGYLQQYEEALKEIVQKSSDDSIPSFSKIAFKKSTKTNQRRKETLEAIGEQSECSPDEAYESDSMLAAGVNNLQKCESFSEGSKVSSPYSESSGDVVFEDSTDSDNKPKENEKMKVNKHENAHTCTHVNGEHQKEVEKHYPVVLLILMEFCKGSTLREWLNRPERSDVPLKYTMSQCGIPVEFHLFRQLVKGLRDIHANNFIHRDLKPENIFVDPKTYALKIGDFGLVAFISQDNHKEHKTKAIDAKRPVDTSQTSLPGQVIGTPGYTAPEGGVNCTEKADIFSAALILLELLSPRFSTAMERFAVLETFRNTRRVPAFISSELKPWHELLQKMADPVPQNRPSAADIQKTLKDIIDTPEHKTTQ